MGIENLPLCPRKEEGLDCPKDPLQCPEQMRNWVNRHFDSETTLAREKGLTESRKIIAVERPAIEAEFRNRGCTLLATIYWARVETARLTAERLLRDR